MSAQKAIELAYYGPRQVFLFLSTPQGKKGFRALIKARLPQLKPAVRKGLPKNLLQAYDNLPTPIVKLLDSDHTFAALVFNAIATWGGIVTDANDAFIYTCQMGWIDLGHFWLSALAGYTLGARSAYLLGYLVEVLQFITPPIGPLVEWHKSAFTVEDLPSNYLGAAFGQFLRNKRANQIGPLFKRELQKWKPIDIRDPKILDIVKLNALKLKENNTQLFWPPVIAPRVYRDELIRKLAHLCQ